MTPADAWLATQGQLELQLHRSTYNTWVRDCKFVSYDNGIYTIEVRNQYVQDWMQQRLYRAIKHAVSTILHETVEVQFVIQKPSPVYYYNQDDKDTIDFDLGKFRDEQSQEKQENEDDLRARIKELERANRRLETENALLRQQYDNTPAGVKVINTPELTGQIVLDYRFLSEVRETLMRGNNARVLMALLLAAGPRGVTHIKGKDLCELLGNSGRGFKVTTELENAGVILRDGKSISIIPVIGNISQMFPVGKHPTGNVSSEETNSKHETEGEGENVSCGETNLEGISEMFPVGKHPTGNVSCEETNDPSVCMYVEDISRNKTNIHTKTASPQKRKSRPPIPIEHIPLVAELKSEIDFDPGAYDIGRLFDGRTHDEIRILAKKAKEVGNKPPALLVSWLRGDSPLPVMVM